MLRAPFAARSCRYFRGVKALVTDVHLRSALAGLRGLGRAGVDVLAAAPTRAAPGLWSRYTAGRERAARDGEPAGEWLAAVARREGPFVVYPGQEHTIDALLAARPGLPEGVVVPYPNAEALRLLRDKRALAELAADSGLGAPATLSEGTASELASSAPPLPFALKPARPGGALPTTRVVESPEQLRSLLAGLPPDEPLLVQERASGPLVAVALVTGGDGRLLARFQQVATRTWPPEAGNSSLAVSVAPDEALARRGRRYPHRCRLLGARAAAVHPDRRRPSVDRRQPPLLRLAAACPRLRREPSRGLARVALRRGRDRHPATTGWA